MNTDETQISKTNLSVCISENKIELDCIKHLNWSIHMSKRKFVLIFIFLVLQIFDLPIALAQGTLTPAWITYLSNMGEPNSGSVLFGSDLWIAQSFKTGTAIEGYTTYNLLGISATLTPDSEFSFYSDNNSVPGTGIGLAGITLLPNTTYWLVATASEPSQSPGGGVQVFTKSWNYSNDVNYSSVDGWSVSPTFALSTNGSNWTTSTSHFPFQFAINANPAPEPSTYALFGLGLATVLFCRRRLHRFSQRQISSA